jgi:hypothetical protein
MYAILEIVFAILVRVLRWAGRNARPLIGLGAGAGFGFAFGLSLAKFGPLPKGVMLMFVAIGVVVVGPAVVGFLNRIAPKG